MEQKTAIVTGAGSGIGRATAVLLAEAGYAVALVGRNEARLAETAGAISASAGSRESVRAIVADLTDAEAPRRVVTETLQASGRIDALVNVAGFAPLQAIEAITPDVWRQTIDVNLSGPVLLTAAAWPTLQRQRSGVIVNVSSMSSIDPFPGFNIYAAAKIGLNMFTKCTADEGAAIGVRAVAIAPGAVETQMLRQHFDERVISSERTLSATDVAAVMRDCVTGERAFTSGETIVLPSP